MIKHWVVGVIIVFACILYIDCCYSGQVGIVHSSGYKYYVNNNQSAAEKQRKVNQLHELRMRMQRLLKVLHSNATYNQDAGVQRLLHASRQHDIQLDELENRRSLQRVFAFNINKGERISICLAPENDINELMFVLLHELAHSMTPEYDHNPAFWANFTFLIDVAHKEELYTNVNYSQNPKPFCKHKVDHNPWYDKKKV